MPAGATHIARARESTTTTVIAIARLRGNGACTPAIRGRPASGTATVGSPIQLRRIAVKLDRESGLVDRPGRVDHVEV